MQHVVVVGSGIGGGVMALKLLQEGCRVTLIERGRLRTWNTSHPPLSIRSLHFAGPRGVRTHHLQRDGYWSLEVHPEQSFLSVSAVGGGADVFTGALVRPGDAWLKQLPPHWRSKFHAVSDEIRDLLGAAPPQRGEQNTIFDEALKHAGNGEAASPHWVCDSRDASGGKGGVNVIARKLDPWIGRGLDLKSGTELSAIERRDRGYRLHLKDVYTGHCHEIDARKVVLGLGALQTPRVLLESRYTHLTLPRLPRSVGHGASGNGDRFSLLWDAMRVDKSAASRALAGLMSTGPRSSMALFSLQAMLPPWLRRGALARSILALSMTEGADAMHRLTEGTTMLTRVGQEPGTSPEALDSVSAWYEANRIERDLRPLGRTLSVHPTGGLSLGSVAGGDVFHNEGHIQGLPGLYVSDASLLPTAPGVPPSFTIATLSRIMAEYVLA